MGYIGRTRPLRTQLVSKEDVQAVETCTTTGLSVASGSEFGDEGSDMRSPTG